MDREMVSELALRLAPIAEKAVEQYVKQQEYLAGINYLVACIGAGLLIVAVLTGVYAYIKDQWGTPQFTSVTSVVCGIVGLCMAIGGWAQNIQHTANAIAPYASILGGK